MKNFEKDLSKELEKYSQHVQEKLEEEVGYFAKEGVKRLKKNSPKRTKSYSKGWKKKKQKDGRLIIYNKEHYMLTHLLEFGHVKRNGGRVEAQPHIGKVENFIIKDFQKRVKEILK